MGENEIKGLKRFSSYTVDYIDESVDFNGDKAQTFKVTLGDNGDMTPDELSEVLVDLLESGL